jgi:hypothetical protein
MSGYDIQLIIVEIERHAERQLPPDIDDAGAEVQVWVRARGRDHFERRPLIQRRHAENAQGMLLPDLLPNSVAEDGTKRDGEWSEPQNQQTSREPPG